MRRIAFLLALSFVLAVALPAQAAPPELSTSLRAQRSNLSVDEGLLRRSAPRNDLLVTPDEARTVATNWIALTVHYEGKWGDSKTARVAEVREFKRGDRLLGYFCRVEPKGYIIVSLRRELAPVRAYSVRTPMNPDSEDEYTAVVKMRMEGILDRIEKEVGPVAAAPSDDVARILTTDHRPTWDELARGVDAFAAVLQSGTLAMTSEERVLPVTSTWHQGSPYKNQVPPVPQQDCDYYPPIPHAGCVAIAAAQIMRYWAWPPYGVGVPYNDFYDWPNMLDSYAYGGNVVQRDAVAELCYEAGKAAATDYGCDSSDAWVGGRPGADMTDAFKSVFRYNENLDFEQRWHISDDDWFNIIKSNIDANQPLQYAYLWADSNAANWSASGTASHSMVCDGWRIAGTQRFFHMNYGWGDTCRWDDITDISGAEGVIRKIRPAPSMGTWLGSVATYTAPSFPYRYFNQDATGWDVTFDAGQRLQFLSGVKVIGASPTGAKIRFFGWSTANTLLFAGGNQSRGIRIHSGHLYLFNGGGIRMY